MRLIVKVQCQKCRDYFWFPFANWRRTSSWSDISFSSPSWCLALFFLLFLCFFEVVTASSGWGSFSLSFLFLVEVVTTGSGSGDGDRLRFFLCFFCGGVACVMKSTASSSSSSLSTSTTFLLFFATDNPFSGRFFFRARRLKVSWDKSSSSSTGLGWYLLVCLALASGWSSSSLSTSVLMPPTWRVDGRLLCPTSVCRWWWQTSSGCGWSSRWALGFWIGMWQGPSRSAGPCLMAVILIVFQICSRIPIVGGSFNGAPPHQDVVY